MRYTARSTDMRRLMQLSEAKRPDDVAALFSHLYKRGWRPVDNAAHAYGVVMRKAKTPYVVKLFSTEDRAYEAFVRLAREHPNPHFPQFRSNVKRVTGRCHLVAIEPLTPASSPAMFKFCHLTALYMENRDDPGPAALACVSASPHLKEACDLIADHLLTRFNLDLEVGNNVMLRGETFVFSDPVAIARSW